MIPGRLFPEIYKYTTCLSLLCLTCHVFQFLLRKSPVIPDTDMFRRLLYDLCKLFLHGLLYNTFVDNTLL